jgi:hypothetical protein
VSTPATRQATRATAALVHAPCVCATFLASAHGPLGGLRARPGPCRVPLRSRLRARLSASPRPARRRPHDRNRAAAAASGPDPRPGSAPEPVRYRAASTPRNQSHCRLRGPELTLRVAPPSRPVTASASGRAHTDRPRTGTSPGASPVAATTTRNRPRCPSGRAYFRSDLALRGPAGPAPRPVLVVAAQPKLAAKPSRPRQRQRRSVAHGNTLLLPVWGIWAARRVSGRGRGGRVGTRRGGRRARR